MQLSNKYFGIKTVNGMIKCGCGNHEVNQLDEKVVYYKGRMWHLRCIFLKEEKRLPRIISKFKEMEKEIDAYHKMRIKFIRMKNFMRDCLCDTCKEIVGNRFSLTDNGILCGKCTRNIKSINASDDIPF